MNTTRTSDLSFALAELWAAIDGKHDAFMRESDGSIASSDPTYTGHYDGYLAEADAFLEDGITCCRGLEVEHQIYQLHMANTPKPEAEK